MLFIHQNGGQNAGCTFPMAKFSNRIQSVTFIQNIVDDQNGAPFNALRRANLPFQP